MSDTRAKLNGVVYVRGFAPISRPDARVLILGSMPSRESLARRQYYAHPRNAFWPILSGLLELQSSDYASRAREVASRGVAIWDVLQACFRAGSLDSGIDDRTIVTNDFAAFFENHPRIVRIFFNGAKAESVYRRHILPGLQEAWTSLPRQRLPSTSPAHAAMSPQQKQEAWRVILEAGLE